MERRGFLASLVGLFAAPVATASGGFYEKTGLGAWKWSSAGGLMAGEVVDWSEIAQPIGPVQICEFIPTDDLARLLAPREPPYGSAAWFFA